MLTAPEHLRGKLHRFMPQSLRDERKDWIIEQLNKSCSVKKIADALSVAPRSIYKIVKVTTHTNAPKLVAPAYLRAGQPPQSILDARKEWAVKAGRAGWSAQAVGDALGISWKAARLIMESGGWKWYEQRGKRIIRREHNPHCR